MKNGSGYFLNDILEFGLEQSKSTCCFFDHFFELIHSKIRFKSSVNCFLRLILDKTQFNTYSDLQKNGEGTALVSVGSSKTNIASITEMIINFLSIVLVVEIVTIIVVETVKIE